uniref:Uncharacterized protein n=1 Tax=Cucumis melo TaxID=3656 RepID=A0A9I9EHM5_CUCME
MTAVFRQSYLQVQMLFSPDSFEFTTHDVKRRRNRTLIHKTGKTGGKFHNFPFGQRQLNTTKEKKTEMLIS